MKTDLFLNKILLVARMTFSSSNFAVPQLKDDITTFDVHMLTRK